MRLPIIAIVGRPNVGKSTLFNRLVGQRHAVTSPIPGTTRDRIYRETDIGGFSVMLADTGGMEFEKKQHIEADVQAQARIAVGEADVILFVVDGAEGLTSRDYDCAKYLRTSKHPVILIANKTDHKKSEQVLPELFELGFGEAIGVSGIHNLGISDLEEKTAKILKKLSFKKSLAKNDPRTKIAIVGKPNVGKSSLINALTREKRLIVSDMPGTTIDATDTPIRREGRDFVLIDTAGLRRRGKIGKGVEKFGTLRSIAAIVRSDITCLIIDFSETLTRQDLHVCQYVLEAEKGLILIVNKSDLMSDPEEEQKKFLKLLHYRMGFAPWAPVLFTSALTEKNIFRIFELASGIHDERKKKIPQKDFSLFLRATLDAHPPSRGGQKIIISNGEQTGTEPPTFTFGTNKPDLVHFSFRRFLENELRRHYGFFGTPVKLEFNRSRN